jgi:predicted glycoside hydrolase/deacetylase ChbG (UPF0249 family)
MNRSFKTFFTFIFFSFFLFAQKDTKTTKYLILHADDLGLSHSVNKATFQALENRSISSASLMVPCPWFLEAAETIKEKPDLDIGIHLTLTAEWKDYKWGGVSPSNEIASLLDKNGYFYPTVEEVVQHAKPAEIEKELKAQIEKAMAMGVKPTHLDSHMGTLFATPELFMIYIKLGQIYHLPVFLPRDAAEAKPELFSLLDKNQILIDHYDMMEKNREAKNWISFYEGLIKELKPGLNQIIIHLALDNEEMKAVCRSHDDFGSAWRQNDLNTVQSKAFKKILKENRIKLIGWKDVK